MLSSAHISKEGSKMAECDRCKKKFGRLDVVIQKNIDGKELCLCHDCFLRADFEQKNQVLNKLNNSYVFFTMPLTFYLDKERNKELGQWYGLNFSFGYLMFTSKGVCFAITDMVENSSNPFSQGSTPFYSNSIKFGTNSYEFTNPFKIRSIIGNELESNKKKVKENKELLQKSKRLTFIPIESIKDLSWGQSSEFTIVTTDNSYLFVFITEKNDEGLFAPKVRDYISYARDKSQEASQNLFKSAEQLTLNLYFEPVEVKSSVRLCSYCKNQNALDAKFCCNCGKEIQPPRNDALPVTADAMPDSSLRNSTNEMTIDTIRYLAVWQSSTKYDLYVTNKRMVFINTINADSLVTIGSGVIDHFYVKKKKKQKEELEEQRKHLTLDELSRTPQSFQINLNDILGIKIRRKRFIPNMYIELQHNAHHEFLLKPEQYTQLSWVLPNVSELKGRVVVTK
jgi:hypothetical protein